jgi:predicted phage terminase large subunit-like protein
LVEDKANGTAIMDACRQDIAGITEIDPKGSKLARALATTPAIRAGDVYLPHPHFFPWVNAYIDEFAKFPNAAKDDQVDATSQILNYWQSEGNQSVSELSSVNRESRKSLSGRVGNQW